MCNFLGCWKGIVLLFLFPVKMVYILAPSTELLAQKQKWFEIYGEKFRDTVVSNGFHQWFMDSTWPGYLEENFETNLHHSTFDEERAQK